jgi:hypothetical protein
LARQLEDMVAANLAVESASAARRGTVVAI